LCIYTDADYQNGRGMSILTTPDIASFVARHSRAYGSYPYDISYRQKLPFFDQKRIKYQLIEKPGRGIGVFANGTFRPGEIILNSYPTIAIHQKAIHVLPHNIRQAMQWHTMSQLPKKTQDLTRSLAKQGRGDDEIEDLLKTNAIGQSYAWDDENRHTILAPEIARINHDCRPNAIYRTDDSGIAQEVSALMLIKPGEEITFSYAPSELGHNARRKYLKDNWGFDCECSLCTATPERTKISDGRLRKIEELSNTLPELDDKSSFLAILGEIIDLYNKEGLIAPLGTYYQLAALTASELGLLEPTKKYAKLAVKQFEMTSGFETQEGRDMALLLSNPEKHPSW
ncbi:SET domain-containing protein, partial [Patellaria atrata CBS 101060]